MASHKSLLAFTVLFAVSIAQVGVMADLYDQCLRMGRSVSFSEDINENDPEKVFSYGRTYLLTTLSPTTTLERQRLVIAWDRVIHDAKCSKSSFKDVAVIARCAPHTNDSLRTFHKAAKSYSKKCLTPEYVGKRIVSKSAGTLSNTLFGDVTKFIDTEFLKNYRAHNPNDRPLHTGAITGPNCCSPTRAIPAIVDAIERHLQKSGKNIRTEFADDYDKLASFLYRHLFTPCKHYESALDKMMFDIFEMDGSGLIAGGDMGLFESLSPERQDDVLRYKLCENLHYHSDKERVYSRVVDWLKENA